MIDRVIYIKKYSGELEVFSFEKLKNSLMKSGSPIEEIESIISIIKPKLYDGITSKEVYKTAFSLLKKANKTVASKYSLKRAIHDLGPTGYPFERLIGALLKQKGYKTEVSVTLKGGCVEHEIDVLAEKDGDIFTIECKFHNKPGFTNNVKIPLYIHSRFLDVQKRWNNDSEKTTHLKQGWIVTNTKFTEDAKQFATCAGLHLLSWNYPKNNGISESIDRFGLYPITVLTSLTKREKEHLIEKDIILVQELLATSNKLKKTGLSSKKIQKVIAEAQKLCEVKL